jgi:hypothetical protein
MTCRICLSFVCEFVCIIATNSYLMQSVTGPTFRIKPYAHPKYKFVVRAKLAGKWKRSYFKSEAEAAAYADNQNASLEEQVKQQQSGRRRSFGTKTVGRHCKEILQGIGVLQRRRSRDLFAASRCAVHKLSIFLRLRSVTAIFCWICSSVRPQALKDSYESSLNLR